MTLKMECWKNLKEMQKLAYVEASFSRLIQELQHVKQLRKLAITKVTSEHGRALCCVIEEMKHLRSLGIQAVNHEETLDLQYVISPPPSLERMYLKGRLERMPDWVKNLNNLVILHLNFSRLEDDPAQALLMLRNLVWLTLNDAYVGEKLDSGFTTFSKLEKLELYSLYNLKSMVGVDFPVLKVIELEKCPHLGNIGDILQRQLSITTKWWNASLASSRNNSICNG